MRLSQNGVWLRSNLEYLNRLRNHFSLRGLSGRCHQIDLIKMMSNWCHQCLHNVHHNLWFTNAHCWTGLPIKMINSCNSGIQMMMVNSSNDSDIQIFLNFGWLGHFFVGLSNWRKNAPFLNSNFEVIRVTVFVEILISYESHKIANLQFFCHKQLPDSSSQRSPKDYKWSTGLTIQRKCH